MTQLKPAIYFKTLSPTTIKESICTVVLTKSNFQGIQDKIHNSVIK